MKERKRPAREYRRHISKLFDSILVGAPRFAPSPEWQGKRLISEGEAKLVNYVLLQIADDDTREKMQQIWRRKVIAKGESLAQPYVREDYPEYGKEEEYWYE